MLTSVPTGLIDFQGDGGWFNKVKLFNFTYTQ